MTESTLLSLLGGAFGLVLAVGGISVVKQFSPASIPRLDQTSLDYPVLLFTLALSALTGVLFGLSPALRLSRKDLQDSLKFGGPAGGSGMRTSMWRAARVDPMVALRYE